MSKAPTKLNDSNATLEGQADFEAKSGNFGCSYNIFQVLLVTFANAFFCWLCISMGPHRKAHQSSLPIEWLQAGCVASALLAAVVPLIWLAYKMRWCATNFYSFPQTAGMAPKAFLTYIGRSIHLSEAFVYLGLMMFFVGAPLVASACVPAVALGLDVFLLLPWTIRYKAEWDKKHHLC